MSKTSNYIKPYVFPLFLILSILLGGLAGYFLGPKAQLFKPLGDIFLNLIFTTIVPLIFFSVSSAIARLGSIGKIGTLIFYMIMVFLFTGLVAALFGLITITLFPPAKGFSLQLGMSETIEHKPFSNQIADIFTVSDFSKLLSHEHILALILFSILVGLSVASSGKKGNGFNDFLQAGEHIFMRVFGLIMYYAPIGFFAYFAVMVNELGPQILGGYVRIAVVYYLCALIYFLFGFTGYAYLAGKIKGIKLFWANVFIPMITALATCSSAASIPANLAATKEMCVSPAIYETSIPLGTIIHKDGSVLGGLFKIAFLFGIFHLDFTGLSVLLLAIGVSLLVGTVMGAIPSGGMLGELLILNVYGFPPSALISIAAISIIIDPMATMLNVTGNSVSSMMINRLIEGKNWL
jgi:Na+/H+-dicarboxylate symporter